MFKSLVEEGKRCLQCKKPLCTEGCPVRTDIKTMIHLFLEGGIQEAGEMLFENNPLSVVCSLVCPHERQCEGHCVLNRKGKPVDIGEIEHYISSYYLNRMKPRSQVRRDRKVAIIGSGPAGITISILLAQRGYDVTIFEAHDRIGGVLMYGIPEFRLPKSILETLKGKMLEMGIKVRPNTLIGPILSIDDLFRDGYKAVFIGTGVWKPRPLGIKGESLGHVHYAIDYLKNPDVYVLGESLAVIGAGNVAMDVARTAVRKGIRNVYIFYRGPMESIAADKHEVEYARIDGVQFALMKQPVEISDDGILYRDTTPAGEGEERPVELFPVDSVIIAISQGPRANIISTTTGISIGKGGLVAVDDCGRTTRPGVFASGDVVTGAKTVVEAVRLSKKVADAIQAHVEGVDCGC
ncbi:NAD(P)-dependent oxidoreductase [Anaerotalea alkaliphila]|uniref:NAD(P)-dependent oxidoreductase n=1 Tax=Anaerotalea alkaliphila TaxID=2662126 RepID=A0A7X5KN30_9FIRM|nr:NAD(P)-dependent oxidoreductase [Anaerotalea alkaliphila]NDL67353.1 NAD(P)-dependent oxidoreductase [Anaerotalea alkaliphila]